MAEQISMIGTVILMMVVDFKKIANLIIFMSIILFNELTSFSKVRIRRFYIFSDIRYYFLKQKLPVLKIFLKLHQKGQNYEYKQNSRQKRSS